MSGKHLTLISQYHDRDGRLVDVYRNEYGQESHHFHFTPLDFVEYQIKVEKATQQLYDEKINTELKRLEYHEVAASARERVSQIANNARRRLPGHNGKDIGNVPYRWED
jgi:hypothetical protein